jgi:hypothetical protein
MRKKITVLLAAVMMVLTIASPAAAQVGLSITHESIPEGVPGHEHAPYPS